MTQYRLMKLLDNIYNRVKYDTLENEEKKELYNILIPFADGDYEVRE